MKYSIAESLPATRQRCKNSATLATLPAPAASR
jgi:hypothetical protein